MPQTVDNTHHKDEIMTQPLLLVRRESLVYFQVTIKFQNKKEVN